MIGVAQPCPKRETLAESLCRPDSSYKQLPQERTRRIFMPGILAMVTVWLVQSAFDRYCGNPAWVYHVRIPFTHILPLIHPDLMVSFAVAGAISALSGSFVNSSRKQRCIAALFPAFFEILKWLWLLRFPLAPWIDPAHPPYRFGKLPVEASIAYWVIHIIIPAAALLGTLSFANRWLYTGVAEEIKSARTI